MSSFLPFPLIFTALPCSFRVRRVRVCRDISCVLVTLRPLSYVGMICKKVSNDVIASLGRELLELTCRLGNTLKRQGVKQGDRVTIYMPPCPLAVASMLACARIGAVHAVVFAGFSAESLADRIRDGKRHKRVTATYFPWGTVLSFLVQQLSWAQGCVDGKRFLGETPWAL